MKSVFSVLVGYLVFGVSAVVLFQLAAVDPRQEPEISFRIWSTVYGIFFAALAGYVAARIAGKKEIKHSVAVAGIMAVIATVSLIAQPGYGSLWSQIAVLGFMVPATVLGGAVRVQQMRKKS